MIKTSMTTITLGLSLSIFLLLSICLQEPASADKLGVTTPRVTAMGQAGIGGALANSALVLNPAGMSAGSFYAIDANYFRSSEEANLIGINIVDSQLRYTKDRVAVGIGYQTQLKSGDTSGHDVLLGLSKAVSKIGTTLLLGGVSGRYIYDQSTGRDGFNLNAGLMLQASSFISIGAVGYDLLEAGDRSFGAGLGITSRQLSINLDYLRQVELAQNQYRIGAEAMISDGFAIRAGYLHNQDQEVTNNTLEVANLVSRYRFTSSQWSAGVAMIGLGGGDGQLSFSYTQPLDSDAFFFGFSLSTYLNM